MKLIKYSIIAGIATLAAAAVSPVEATWYDNGVRTQSWSSSGGWSSGGIGQSDRRWPGRGWGSSGWGSSGWGSSGWGSSSYGGTSGGSTGSTGGTSGSTGSSSGGSSTGGAQVPEPSNVLMLGLGVAGLIAGRLAARRGRKDR